MPKPSRNDELFDVNYDVCETLFDRIRELMDKQDDLVVLKAIREQVVQVVAAMEQVTPESVYRGLEDIRKTSRADR